MAKNTTPAYVITAQVANVELTAAVTDSSSAAGATLLYTIPTDDAKPYVIRFINSQVTQAASSAMVGKVWITDSAGATLALYEEGLMAAATRSGTVKGSTVDILIDRVLQAGCKIYVAKNVHAGAQDNVVAQFLGAKYV